MAARNTGSARITPPVAAVPGRRATAQRPRRTVVQQTRQCPRRRNRAAPAMWQVAVAVPAAHYRAAPRVWAPQEPPAARSPARQAPPESRAQAQARRGLRERPALARRRGRRPPESMAPPPVRPPRGLQARERLPRWPQPQRVPRAATRAAGRAAATRAAAQEWPPPLPGAAVGRGAVLPPAAVHPTVPRETPPRADSVGPTLRGRVQRSAAGRHGSRRLEEGCRRGCTSDDRNRRYRRKYRRNRYCGKRNRRRRDRRRLNQRGGRSAHRRKRKRIGDRRNHRQCLERRGYRTGSRQCGHTVDDALHGHRRKRRRLGHNAVQRGCRGVQRFGNGRWFSGQLLHKIQTGHARARLSRRGTTPQHERKHHHGRGRRHTEAVHCACHGLSLNSSSAPPPAEKRIVLQKLLKWYSGRLPNRYGPEPLR